ncbi:MAG: methyltransferase domain-containing protein [Deltaproteobacteria bacterium]|nr:methyltransferase domain-containing protein [Deltaproteobacteria bacterium]
MELFTQKLKRSLQEMYDRACSCNNGLLSQVAVDRGVGLLEKLGYALDLLAILPPESDGLAFPCANPLPRIISLAPQSILDLGCGMALDAFFCARSLPCLERLTGLDASPKLLAKGKDLLFNFPAEARKITLLAGDLNSLSCDPTNPCLFQPFELILMNGSFNLVYAKKKFFAELRPLLTQNGTLLIYDFILTESLPPGFADEVDNWLWNIAGALDAIALEKVVTAAGLALLEINELERIDPVARCEIIIKKKNGVGKAGLNGWHQS